MDDSGHSLTPPSFASFATSRENLSHGESREPVPGELIPQRRRDAEEAWITWHFRSSPQQGGFPGFRVFRVFRGSCLPGGALTTKHKKSHERETGQLQGTGSTDRPRNHDVRLPIPTRCSGDPHRSNTPPFVASLAASRENFPLGAATSGRRHPRIQRMTRATAPPPLLRLLRNFATSRDPPRLPRCRRTADPQQKGAAMHIAAP